MMEFKYSPRCIYPDTKPNPLFNGYPVSLVTLIPLTPRTGLWGKPWKTKFCGVPTNEVEVHSSLVVGKGLQFLHREPGQMIVNI